MKPTRKDIYKAIQLANRKLDILLRHHAIDFSVEDTEVRRQTEEINVARGQIPHTDLKA